MCNITKPASAPIAGTAYYLTISGATPIDWEWGISNEGGSDSGTEQTSPATICIQVPTGTSGETLAFSISCSGGGSDSISKTIQ